MSWTRVLKANDENFNVSKDSIYNLVVDKMLENPTEYTSADFMDGWIEYNHKGTTMYCKNMKNRGVPQVKNYDSYSYDFDSILNDMRTEFSNQLDNEFSGFMIGGRNGGYWGFDVSNVFDYVEFHESEINKQIDEFISAFKKDYEQGKIEGYDEDDIANAVADVIKIEPAKYIYANEYWKDFDNTLENIANEWESQVWE